jgi:hypothetical protein
LRNLGIEAIKENAECGIERRGKMEALRLRFEAEKDRRLENQKIRRLEKDRR